ncbi:unnamed protein product, partial [Mesorhabditis belari]|uniref:NTR domain-containing protein n=1 Tax=Mesorhabditis belari TaxID=2138241 RepID=A0AAF3J3R4_9BILA
MMLFDEQSDVKTGPITDPLPPTTTTVPTIDVCFCPFHPGNFMEQACQQQWISKGEVLAVKQVTWKGETENIYTVNHLEIFRGGATLSSRLLSPTLCGVKLNINRTYLLSGSFIRKTKKLTSGGCFSLDGGQTLWSKVHVNQQKELEQIKCPTGTTIPPP